MTAVIEITYPTHGSFTEIVKALLWELRDYPSANLMIRSIEDSEYALLNRLLSCVTYIHTYIHTVLKLDVIVTKPPLCLANIHSHRRQNDWAIATGTC